MRQAPTRFRPLRIHPAHKLCALMIVTLAAADSIAAKNVSRLWYSSGSVAFHSTQEGIGSNADQAGDIRPDDFANRKMGIEDTGSFSLTAGFGLTRWLSLQVDAGYFKGGVEAIDVYLQDAFPKASDPSTPEVLNLVGNRKTAIPTTVGRLTEIPVGISGVLRFRQDRNVNPYIGAGLGMVFTGIEADQDIAALNTRLASLRIKGETSETNRNLVAPRYEPFRAQGRIPFTNPITVDVKNGFEWHLMAGMEYFFGERVSLVADVRYTFAVSAVEVDLNGEDQVNFQIYSEKLFRPDGSLKLFETGGSLPNPFVDPNDLSKGPVRCARNTVGDFDHDGHADDYCYVNSSFRRGDDPVGVLLVQGGRVNLSGYNLQVGMRIYF